MIDLTLNEYDKENFITNVILSDDLSKFSVIYADGSSTVEDFNIDDFNNVLFKMEKQFYLYKEAFLKFTNKRKMIEISKILVSVIIETFVTVGIFYMDISNFGKVCNFLILYFLISIYQYCVNSNLEEDVSLIDVVRLSEKYLSNKEMFAVSYFDKNSKQEKKWYVINLSNIENYKKCKKINDLRFDVLNDLEEGKKLVKKFEEL